MTVLPDPDTGEEESRFPFESTFEQRKLCEMWIALC